MMLLLDCCTFFPTVSRLEMTRFSFPINEALPRLSNAYREIPATLAGFSSGCFLFWTGFFRNAGLRGSSRLGTGSWSITLKWNPSGQSSWSAIVCIWKAPNLILLRFSRCSVIHSDYLPKPSAYITKAMGSIPCFLPKQKDILSCWVCPWNNFSFIILFEIKSNLSSFGDLDWKNEFKVYRKAFRCHRQKRPPFKYVHANSRKKLLISACFAWLKGWKVL